MFEDWTLFGLTFGAPASTCALVVSVSTIVDSERSSIKFESWRPRARCLCQAETNGEISRPGVLGAGVEEADPSSSRSMEARGTNCGLYTSVWLSLGAGEVFLDQLRKLI